MTRIPEMLATLRTLDPADPAVDPRNPRARAELERILTVLPDLTPVKARRRHGIRLVAAAATVVTAGAAFFVLPSLTNGDRAFGSWTAVPTGLSAEAAADAGAKCRDAHMDGDAQPAAPGPDYRDDLRRADIAIAEQRGKWTLVTLADTKGFSALCISDNWTALFPSWFGSIGTPTNYAAPGPRVVVATSLGTGSIDGSDLSVAAGYVGSDVTGVTYDSVSHGLVAATVSAGQFALWLPGGELMDAAGVGVNVQVTYRDGSTATVRLDLR